MSEIKQEVLDLAEKLAAEIQVAKDGAVAITEDLYKKYLPESIKPELLEEQQKFNSQFFAATAKVVGEKAIDAMKKNAELNEVNAAVPLIGKDAFEMSFKRSVARPDPQGNGTTTSYGSLSSKVVTYAAGASRGQLLKVRKELSEAATAAFGG